MSLTLKIILFILITTGLIRVSWPALRRIHSHGWYRFFAWEGILILFLMNAEFWFLHPFSIHQIISWSLLLLSIFIALYGFRLLKATGHPDPGREDSTLIAFEKTHHLVTTGAYRWIRHPLYSSLLFLAWGIFSKHPSLWGLGIVGVTTLFLYLTARVEERENVAFFGKEYEEYMKTTRMFIPGLF